MKNTYIEQLLHQACALSMMYHTIIYKCDKVQYGKMPLVYDTLALNVANYITESDKEPEEAIDMMKEFLSATCSLDTAVLHDIACIWREAVRFVQEGYMDEE